MWASGHNGKIRRAAYGYEPTREAARQVAKELAKRLNLGQPGGLPHFGG
jgi:hypothetical protein